MNTPDFTRVWSFTKFLALVLVLALPLSDASAEWSVDLSRRARATRENDLQMAAQEAGARSPASARAGEEGAPSAGRGVLDQLFDAGEPVQEIVILSTDKGFVPSTVRVRKGGRYTVHVVNVNEKEKNISFILDGFSEHHATYYGKMKSFRLEPKKEGVYSFQAPETSFEGRLVVFTPQLAVPVSSVRAPAGEEPAK